MGWDDEIRDLLRQINDKIGSIDDSLADLRRRQTGADAAHRQRVSAEPVRVIPIIGTVR